MLYFDWKFYISRYPDLRNAGINTKEKAWQHWNQFGKKEKRICNSDVAAEEIDFDWIFYTSETTTSVRYLVL